MLEEGGRIGWAALGKAVGRDGEGLRVFAKTPGRTLHPDTEQALQWYFSPAQIAGGVGHAIRAALQKSRETTAALEELARLVEPTTYPTERDQVLRAVAEVAQAQQRAEAEQAAPRPKRKRA